MSLFGKGKKHKNSRKRELSGDRKYFSGIDDYDEDEYYEDDEYEEDEYYEDEAEEEETEESEEKYYEDELSERYGSEVYYGKKSGKYDGDGAYYEEEYYGDDIDYYEDEEEGEDYEENEDDDDLDYIEDGEYEDDDEDDDEFIAYRRKKGVAGAVLAFRNLPLIDKVIAGTGVAVLFFAVLTGVILMTAKQEDKAVAAFAEVGTSLKGVNIIGESGLLAVADAQMAKEAAMETIEEEPEEVVEEEPAQGIDISLKMTSIVKDLKIKFVNTKTDKLVANVPFEVEITTPSKRTETWTDDDKDGVIYRENIEAGTYKVKMSELTGYDEYTFSTETQSVEVKANIAYKKVDIREEIKTEEEVNAAVEDTAVEEVVEESRLADTVPFVQSTQSAEGEPTYKAIDKNTIKDPATVVASARTADYYLMTALGTVSGNNPSPAPELSITGVNVEVGKTAAIGVSQKNVASITWSSDNPSIAKVDNKGNVTGVAAGTVTIRAKGSASGGSASVSAFCTVKVTAAPVAATLKIDQTAVSLAVGDSKTIKAESNQAAVVWEITDKNAEFADVTVSSDGKTVTVKGKKAGTIKLTATVKGSDVQPQTCTVTITDSTVTPDKTSVQVAVKKTVDINVATRPDNITITAESSRKDIATVAVSGKKVTVTGVKIGESIVTIKGSNGKEAKVTVKVVGGYEEDTTSLLKDKDGNQVYVLENGKYREAVYADYYKTDMQYFLKTEGILYTGWQNIDGKTYYYLENHQYVTGEQVIQGAKYNFASDGSLVTSSGTFGIDVSKWNGNIDWNSVKASGASYAIIRCGYRGSSTGALITDPKFAANISGANAAGMKVGVYFFTQAVNEKEAVEEASMVLDLVKKYKISYPIFLDVESSGGRADGIDKGTRTAVCKAFCATIQNSGYTAGVYANKTWLNNKIDAGALGSYKIWLAQYAAAPTYNGRYNLWQYSSKGSVPGIKGNVDLNLSFLGY
jgi:GH25 family lysozyme M1 (1,4-beta-N-acetylmuramidase)